MGLRHILMTTKMHTQRECGCERGRRRKKFRETTVDRERDKVGEKGKKKLKNAKQKKYSLESATPALKKTVSFLPRQHQKAQGLL